MINLSHLIVILNGERVFPSIIGNAHMDVADCIIVKLKPDCPHLNWKVKINHILIDFILYSLDHYYDIIKIRID
ncbi:unnamed protein product, partial [Vitis vinifera]|uniref:Uncharacterized protein n=1 Tax=Vitis vinifera TaxID=29760 RepID=D7TRN8_VITVI